jgi:hypothetical protein
MAKKAELEADHGRYLASCGAVAQAEAARAFHDAVRQAQTSLSLVNPSATYQRRFLKIETPVTPTLNCILRYAPPLFLSQALDAVEAWYATGTRTERNALPNLPRQLESARHLLGEAVKLWSALAASPDAKVGLDGRCPTASALVATWLALGTVTETRLAGYSEYVRTSDPRRAARGKCAVCGQLLSVPLAKLLDPFPCPKCRQSRVFVIVGRSS